jgi:hypothetical protein
MKAIQHASEELITVGNTSSPLRESILGDAFGTASTRCLVGRPWSALEQSGSPAILGEGRYEYPKPAPGVVDGHDDAWCVGGGDLKRTEHVVGTL